MNVLLMPQPAQHTANGALVYSNHGFTLILYAWICLDIKSVFRE